MHERLSKLEQPDRLKHVENLKKEKEIEYLKEYDQYRENWKDLNIFIHKSFEMLNTEENDYVPDLSS